MNTIGRTKKKNREWQCDRYDKEKFFENLKGTDGKISVRTGQLRRGGSYIQRFENIAVWNSVMPNYDYSLNKWNEFVLAK